MGWAVLRKWVQDAEKMQHSITDQPPLRLAECEDRSGRSNKPQQEGTAEPDREKLGRPRLNTRENTQ